MKNTEKHEDIHAKTRGEQNNNTLSPTEYEIIDLCEA